MSISHFIKIIGRGKEGARHLSRMDAADLLGQVLDGTLTDLEIGAFCIAMRIKGETPQEMAGFLDATLRRTCLIPTHGCPSVVLPCYNGARKLPALTALLALLLARQGLAVVLHGSTTEATRISTQNVLQALAVPSQATITNIAPGEVRFVPTGLLCPGLDKLLAVRQVVGLRNSAHSLVKLMIPCAGPATLVTSYTHPDYATSMADTLTLMGVTALLLRGTEGEPVADARRTPAMDSICHGQVTRVQEAKTGPLAQLPDLPAPDAPATARWIESVLAGHSPVPEPITQQVAHILHLVQQSTRG